MPTAPPPTAAERLVAGLVLSSLLVLSVALLGAPVLALVLPAVLLSGAHLVERIASPPDAARLFEARLAVPAPGRPPC